MKMNWFPTPDSRDDWTWDGILAISDITASMEMYGDPKVQIHISREDMRELAAFINARLEEIEQGTNS